MNPYLKKNKKQLEKQERSRQAHLRKRESNKFATAAVSTAVGAALIHTIHPTGIIGAANDLSKGVSSVSSAFSKTKNQIASHNGLEAKMRSMGVAHASFKNNLVSSWEQGGNTKINDIALGKTKQAYDRFDQVYRSHLLSQKRHKAMDISLDKVAKESEIAQEKAEHFKELYQSRLGYIAGGTDDLSLLRKIKKAGFTEEKEYMGMLGIIQDVKTSTSVDEQSVLNKTKQFKSKIMDNIIKQGEGGGLSGQPRRSLKQKGSDTFLKLFGYKKASIDDIQNLSMNEGVRIQEGTREFMNKVVKAGADATKFIPDENLLVYKGKIISAHSAAGSKRAIKSTFSDGIIGHIMYQKDSMLLDDFAKEPYHFMGIGKHQPTLEHLDQVGKDYRLTETLVGIGDKVYGANDPSTILDSGRIFTSGRYGSAKRLMAQMANINAKDWDNKAWYESKTLGIEKHRRSGTLDKTLSFFGKKRDPRWMPNKVKRAYAEGFDEDLSLELYDYMSINAGAPDAQTLNMMSNLSNSADIRDLSFEDKDQLINSYKHIMNKYKNVEDLDTQIQSIISKGIVQTRKGIGQSNIKLSESELLRKEIAKELIDFEGPLELYGRASALKDVLPGSGYDDIVTNIGDHILSNKVASTGIDYKDPLKNIFDLNKIVSEGDLEGSIVRQSFDILSKKTHPKLGWGVQKDFIDNFDGDVLSLKAFDHRDLKSWADTIFAGRGNMGDVHRGTMVGYGVSTRMNEILRGVDMFSPVSFALPDDDLGSTPAYFGNLFAKRVIPGYVGFEAFKYLNDYAGDSALGDGYTLDQRFQRSQASARFKTANFKDKMPMLDSLTDKLNEVTPGSEGFSEVFHSIPYIGWGAKYTGAFSNKSEEDWADYYQSGTDPVRKGRWWPLGTTPWMGKQIDYHRPNSYKMAMAEHEYTDTLYGSKDEYWSHSFLPTPRHPFAPIKRFVTDRYWLEEKHRETRPYPLSREMFDPNTPWGMPLNATIGNVLKRQKPYGAGASKSTLEELYRDAYEEEHILTRYHGGQPQTVRYFPEEDRGISNLEDVPSETYGDPQITSLTGVKSSVEQAEINKSINTYGRRYKQGVSRPEDGQYISSGHGVLKGSGVDYVAGDLSTIYLDGRERHTADIGAINSAIVSSEGSVTTVGKDSLEKSGHIIPYREPFERGEFNLEVTDPRSLGYRLQRMKEASYYIGGSRGFLAKMLLGDGDYGEGTAVMDTADSAFAGSSRFWAGNFGGRTGGLSEVFRRMLQKEPGLRKKVNNIPNAMPRWLPDIYHTGDAYTAVSGGELRLPGDAYERLNKLHPDEYGTYGAVDRAAILADIAPWSDEAKLWLQRARSQDLTDGANDFLQQKLKESRKQRQRHHITEYEFLNNDVQRSTAVIDRFIDAERFTVKDSDQIYRIAGIHGTMNVEDEVGQAATNILNEYMSPGTEVNLVTPTHHAGVDGQGSLPAVIGQGGQQVNTMLQEAGLTKREESSDISSHLSLGPISRAVGMSWEVVSHARIPLVQSKIFNVNSAMEHYKYNYVYGKDFQSWGKPINDLVKPTFRSAAAQHPIGAAATGGFAGALTGKLLGGGLAGPLGKVGAGVGVGLSLWRQNKEFHEGGAWIPEQARTKREIDTYMDRIQYLKSKSLYNQYAEKAKKEEGVDIEAKVEEMDEYYQEIKEEERKLENYSRKISLEGISSENSVRSYINKEGRLQYSLSTEDDLIKHERSKINERLEEISNQEIIGELGPLARKALEYRDRARSTMVGLDENSTYTQIFKALPKEEREYFNYFSQEQDKEKQDEILDMVPEDLKRVYERIWNRDSEYYDTDSEVEEFFSDFALPGQDWIGWKEGVDLDNARKKLVENEGFDTKDFGLWKNFTEEERLTPAPVRPGKDFRKSSTGSIAATKKQIEKVLKDYDIKDLIIDVEPTKDKGLTIDIDIEQDITDKVKQQVEAAMAGV